MTSSRLDLKYVDPSELRAHSQAKLVPDLRPAELTDLEAQIVKEGRVRVPIEVKADGQTILDGHHRWRIAKKLKLAMVPIQIVTPTEPDAVYILQSAIARRNLSEGQRALLCSTLVDELEKVAAKQKAAQAKEQAQQQPRDEKGRVGTASRTVDTCPRSGKEPSKPKRTEVARAAKVSDRQLKYVQQIKRSTLLKDDERGAMLAEIRAGVPPIKVIRQLREAERKAKIAAQKKDADRLRKQQTHDHAEAEARVKSEEAAARQAEQAKAKAEAQARKAQEEAARQEALAKKATEEAEAKEAREAQRKAEAAQKKAEEEAKHQEAAARKAEAEAKAAAEKAAALAQAMQRFRLHACRAVEAIKLIEAESVDLVVTDPPYSEEYLPVYTELAKLAKHVLKPGGSCLVMTGQSYLPAVITALGAHLDYHWVLAYLTPGGQAPQVFPRKVNTFWKPVLWYTKGKFKGDWKGDVCRSDVNDNDKRFDDWGQSESGVIDLMKRFVEPGMIVLDPFVGGGTMGVVALRLGATFVGIDNNATDIATTQARLTVAATQVAAKRR